MTKCEVKKRKQELFLLAVSTGDISALHTAMQGEEINDAFSRCRSRSEFFENGVQDWHVPTERVRTAKVIHRPAKRYEERIVSHNGKLYRFHREVSDNKKAVPPFLLGTLQDVLNSNRIK